MQRSGGWWAALVTALVVMVVGCEGTIDVGAGKVLTKDEAEAKLAKLVAKVDVRDGLVTQSGRMRVGEGPDIGRTLPDIKTFPLTAKRKRGTQDCAVAELFVSTEKSGDGDDSWMVGEADRFNAAEARDPKPGCNQVEIRKIASGTAYDMIAAGKAIPQGYSPSNGLWTAMLEARGVAVETILPTTVRNVGGIVIKPEVLKKIEEGRGTRSVVEAIIDAVAGGLIAMGYTNPYKSSTGLNMAATAQLIAAGGDETKMGTPAAISVFEAFQRGVPFNAETTLQMRTAMENDSGSLDAFVMEWQTFKNVPELQDFEFVPFGVVHTNPLVAVGELTDGRRRALEAFGEHLAGSEAQERGRKMGFGPEPAYVAPWEIPEGKRLIAAQKLWKEHKDSGRTISAMFVADSSGSMSGPRMRLLKLGLREAIGFINPENEVGMVEFDNAVVVRRPLAKIGEGNTRGLLMGAVDALEPGGGTALYDGVVIALDAVWRRMKQDPNVRGRVFVLSDGDATAGLSFRDIKAIVIALEMPVHTIAYGDEVGRKELKALSALAEAASVKVGPENVEYKLSHMFNAQF